MILSKSQMFLTKVNDKYEVYCHGNICISAPHTFVKFEAYRKTEYVALWYLLSLCNIIDFQYNIYKTFGNTKISWIIMFSMHIVKDSINTTLLTSKRTYRR